MRSKILFTMLFVGFMIFSTLEYAEAEEKALESPQFAAQRKERKHRSRHLIYNNDGYEAENVGADTPDGYLSRRMKPAMDTQVDSVFYCTGATTMFTHRTDKIGETYGKYITDESGESERRYKANLEALAKAGTDPLELAINLCKENDVEIFFTYRINDVHDTFLAWERSTWKREHPEYLVGKPGDWVKYPQHALEGANQFTREDPRRWWTSLDFEKQEVRDYLLAIIDDVLTRYDVDGIEIDYWRAALFFRPTRTYETTTAEQVEILTNFQRRVREKAYEHGNRRGRPILVATRVPSTKKICRYIGIDIEQWLKDDLLDVLTTGGGYVPFTMPTKELVELGHAYDTPVYPTISASGMRGPHSSDAHWRGAASNARHAGADGIVLFNTFPTTPNHPHFMELGDSESLARMDKVFVMDNIPTKHYFWAVPMSQIIPVQLDAEGSSREVVFPVGDDVAGAAKAGTLAGAALRIRFDGMTSEDTVEVQLNGKTIKTQEGAEPGWTSYAVEPTEWLRGDNTLSFRVTSTAGEAEVSVNNVELNVTYK
ncbi:MAG: family 10 glycosylhydrolase [Planctomycetes bacterium]|nr:family 10 glycosylhydrolase [Planctomycetota bacterium]